MKKILMSFFVAALLSACGTAHVKTEAESADILNYTKIYISKVDVHSQEPAAKTNQKLQEKMLEWEGFAMNELETNIEKSRYTLIKSIDDTSPDALSLELDIDLVYGSRAARYFGGFGAGKGSVDSVLKVVDPKTKEIKYSAVANSDLSVGAFGGDMGDVLKSNVTKLIQQYFLSPSAQ
ncbi:hypothetical protein [uncultured Zhongshania sp.]|uniref:hypothetical protein n=1 Tax=uncultured Zhongshania sp. TaxID=1642288 RepID=UPI0030D85FA5|tara:strand:+ start:507 stop:1043 length:537 start_codon:yes stop_codon:yes gene_type:complete